MSKKNEYAPAGNRGATNEIQCVEDLASESTAERGAPGSASTHLPAIPAYMLIVEIKGDKYQRRPYMSLSSAEKAVERARSQGRYATVRLVACTPVPGGDLA
ncbi:Hypothetical protein BJL86_0873 [Dietzia timorensis]|uniref:Uncharacterized protein n=2 Tax=Dietzia timorensis TaxID=499555 RepID=A0A173LK59_9ACTN|nr:Hypothetical protein BJL86_0873 [Dietzia timorensis]